jgi:hypothetical protein
MARVKQPNPKRIRQDDIKEPKFIKPRRITPVAVYASPPSEPLFCTQGTADGSVKSESMIDAAIARILVSIYRRSTYKKCLKTVKRMDGVLGDRQR